MTWTILSVLGVGFALGLKHALDADHLAAVAVIVSERRRSLAGSSAVGLAWGAGHAAAVVAVGLAVILLGVELPDRFAHWMEMGVGAVLVLLGARLVWQCRRGAVLHAHAHAHGNHRHYHPHVHRTDPGAAEGSHHRLPGPARRAAEAVSRGRRPFLIGVMHGMAGSAALMLLVLATIPGAWARLAYVLIFAAGSILGMVLMSALVGLPFALGWLSEGRPQRTLRLAAGSVSFALGIFLILSVAPALQT